MPSANAKKLTKPYADFPLTPQATGYWVKKIRGKIHYFGTRWCEPEDALAAYLRVRDELHAGLTPDSLSTKGDLTLDVAFSQYLADCEERVEMGELSSERFSKYRRTLGRVVKLLGPKKLVEALRPSDFTRVRRSFVEQFAADTAGGEIGRVRTAFRWLYQSDIIESEVKFGPGFKAPPARVIRMEQNDKPDRVFTSAEVLALLDRASDKMRAMILLGINCGFGNGDCAELRVSQIDLGDCYVSFPRPKNGLPRESVLWDETAQVLQEVIDERPKPRERRFADYVFMSYRGQPFQYQQNGNISQEFGKLTRACGVHEAGVGFYALRHTFATIGRRARDQEAIDFMMGHVPTNKVKAGYCEFVERDRMEAVAAEVYAWLYSAK